MEGSELLRIDRAAFMPFLKSHPQLAIRLMSVLCWTSDIIEGTIFLDIPHRHTNWLITLADQYGTKAGVMAQIEVKLSQESLGQMLGSARENISKGLKTLEHKGLIETKSGHISELDMDALEDFAEHQDDG